MKIFFRYCLTTIVLVATITSVPLFPVRAEAIVLNHQGPKIANYYLHWDLNETQARALAAWDVVILDMEVQDRTPDLLRKMRQWNPSIILLAYITPQEIHDNVAATGGRMRGKFAAGIGEGWYLHNSQGSRLAWWPGTNLLNVTNRAPLVNGERFNQYLPRFVSSQILGSGLWDGVFYDNAWDSITFFVGTDIDIDRDGVKDSVADAEWKAGMRFIYDETRRLTGDRYLIVANGTTRAYTDAVNGMMLENFVPPAWSGTMGAYRSNEIAARVPRINIVNANTGNAGNQNNFQQFRFGLTSALMQDGYYAFDYGDRDHGQTWYYDEYDVHLGTPVAPAESQTGAQTYTAGVWKRPFSNGLAVVNSAPTEQTVNLGGEYEKIRGTQDKRVNDGSIVSEITLSGYDGEVLLKTFTVPNDMVFDNGGFARFFHPDGTRSRNGTFLFDGTYQGGDKIAHIDLNGDGQRDVVVVSGAKLSAWRDDGQPYLEVFPYTANYKGELRIAIGDIDGDGGQEIFVAPSDGYPAPIKVYSRNGDLLKDEWFPYGKAYKGGYSLAVGNVDGVGQSEVVVGAGTNRTPTVTLFNSDYRLIRQWLAFESTFRGGVSVAAGDVNGDGTAEVVVGAGKGKGPVIRTFDSKGKLLYREFSAYTTRTKLGINVSAHDVDFDGKAEIIGTSKDIGL